MEIFGWILIGFLLGIYVMGVLINGVFATTKNAPSSFLWPITLVKSWWNNY